MNAEALLRIRLRHVWARRDFTAPFAPAHHWVCRVKGAMFETSPRVETALKMNCNEANRVLKMIISQCPNAEIETAG